MVGVGIFQNSPKHTHERLSSAGVVREEHRHRPLLLPRTP
jgi:hypothetical protein